MKYFEYDTASPKSEYYEILQMLMERWEYEIVEFKEAKGGYNEDKIGQYFSAISNEANLKQQQYGWFVLGVSESVDNILLVLHSNSENQNYWKNSNMEFRKI